MSLGVNAYLDELTTAVRAALDAAGLHNVDLYNARGRPRDNKDQIQLTNYGNLPKRNAAGGDAESGLNFALVCYSLAPTGDEVMRIAAERVINDIETAVSDALPSWRGPAYSWQEVKYARQSNRPSPPADLVQWRMIGIYLLVKI